jgi:cobalt/nickel transport system permease protein
MITLEIDKYASVNSPIHQIDPRAKIVSSIILVIFIISTDKFTALGLYGILLAMLIVLSKIPLSFIFKRSLVIIPFVALISLSLLFLKSPRGEYPNYKLNLILLNVKVEGATKVAITTFFLIIVKAVFSTASMILLMNTMTFHQFTNALHKLRFPRIIAMILSLMYRYIFIIIDELRKMTQAMKARSVIVSKWLRLKALAYMLGTLFIRAFEKAESIYLTMSSRGFNYDSTWGVRNVIQSRDLYFVGIILFLCIIIKTIT